MRPRRPQLVPAPRRCSAWRPSLAADRGASRRCRSSAQRRPLAARGRGRSALLCGSLPGRASSASASACSSTSRSCRRSACPRCSTSRRLRGRPPARAARPAGRARAARRRRGRDGDRAVGYSLMQFLLGVDAPVEPRCCCARSSLTILLDTLLALPVYALVRRWLLPALPDDPRRRRRRAYTTGGLSPLTPRMIDDPASAERPPPADHAAARAARRRCSAGSRSCCSRSSSSASGTCRCCRATSTSRRPTTTGCATCASRRRAATIVDRNGDVARRRTARRPSLQIEPARLPAAQRDAAPSWASRRCAGACRAPRRPVPIPPRRRGRSHAPTLGACSDVDAPISDASSSARVTPYAPDAAPTCPTMRNYLAERQRAVPRRRRSSRVYLRRYPYGRPGRAAARHRRRRSTRKRAQGRRATAACSRARSSARPASSTPTTATCAAATASQRITVDALGQPKGAAASRASRGAGDQLQLSLDLGLQRDRPGARIGARSHGGRATPARSSRWTRATAQVLAMGSSPSFDPNIFAKPLTQRRYDALLRRDRRARCSTARSPAPIRRARRSSRSPRWPALERASSRRTRRSTTRAA